MRRWTALLLLLCAYSLALAEPASAEKRVALVIGNSAYRHAPELANPRNDAVDMAAALKTLGLTVVEGFDLDKQAMDRTLRDFAQALAGADVGVFFYAGHGLQVNGNNYLVPVDAELSTVPALEFEMVRLDLVQRIMEGETKTNILFLDACRNNPLSRNLARAMGTRSAAIGRGLAPAESGVGTLISFSTQPGNVALDGEGRNSPFAGALVKAIATPGEDVLSVLTHVRNEVLAATGERQVPWENHALRARFYFNPAAPEAPSEAVAPRPQAGSAAQEWAALDKTSTAELETFISRHAASPQATYARARLAALEQERRERLARTEFEREVQSAREEAQSAREEMQRMRKEEPPTQHAAIAPRISENANVLGDALFIERNVSPEACVKLCADNPACGKFVHYPKGEMVMPGTFGTARMINRAEECVFYGRNATVISGAGVVYDLRR